MSTYCNQEHITALIALRDGMRLRWDKWLVSKWIDETGSRLEDESIIQFILQNKLVEKSDFFLRWLVLPHFAKRESAFGVSMEFNGKWRKIPEGDWMHKWLQGDNGVQYERLHAEHAVKQVAERLDGIVMFASAGLLPELRHTASYHKPALLFAYDDDPKACEYLPFLNQELGVDLTSRYQCIDAETLLRPNAFSAQLDACFLGHYVNSFCTDEETQKFMSVLKFAQRVLSSNGCLVLDIRTRHTYWRQSGVRWESSVTPEQARFLCDDKETIRWAKVVYGDWALQNTTQLRMDTYTFGCGGVQLILTKVGT